MNFVNYILYFEKLLNKKHKMKFRRLYSAETCFIILRFQKYLRYSEVWGNLCVQRRFTLYTSVSESVKIPTRDRD
jgi:hypothetical protein